MKDIDEFMEYCKGLNHQGLINLIEGLYTQDIMKQMKIERLEKAFELACKKLEDNDSILFDLYDRSDTYYDAKDRHEWKEHLLESVNGDE